MGGGGAPVADPPAASSVIFLAGGGGGGGVANAGVVKFRFEDSSGFCGVGVDAPPPSSPCGSVGGNCSESNSVSPGACTGS